MTICSQGRGSRAAARLGQPRARQRPPRACTPRAGTAPRRRQPPRRTQRTCLAPAVLLAREASAASRRACASATEKRSGSKPPRTPWQLSAAEASRSVLRCSALPRNPGFFSSSSSSCGGAGTAQRLQACQGAGRGRREATGLPATVASRPSRAAAPVPKRRRWGTIQAGRITSSAARLVRVRPHAVQAARVLGRAGAAAVQHGGAPGALPLGQHLHHGQQVRPVVANIVPPPQLLARLLHAAAQACRRKQWAGPSCAGPAQRRSAQPAWRLSAGPSTARLPNTCTRSPRRQRRSSAKPW